MASTRRLLTTGFALTLSTLPILAHAQTLTSRASKVNYSAVYGGGEDTFQPTDSIENLALESADVESLSFMDTQVGLVLDDPARPWGAAVSVATGHVFGVTGPLDAFTRVQASGSTSVAASASGEGLANMTSINPGSELILGFSLANATPVNLSGAVSLDPNGQTLSAYVALQRFDGIVWQNLFNSLFMQGEEGSFDQALNLTPGTYRIVGRSSGNAFAGTRPAQTNEWSYDLEVVPEPASLVVLGVGLVSLMRRRRRD